MDFIGDSKSASVNYGIVTIGVVFGSKGEGAKAHTMLQVRTQHFHPHVGWELKDVVIVGLPMFMRFAELRDWERYDTPKGLVYVLYFRQ